MPTDASWHLWNRNPDLSKHPDHDWHYREGIVSNCVTNLYRRITDVVVFSGSPEWLGPRCEPIFQFIDINPDIPLMLIGIGSAAPLYGMNEVEIRVLSRENTLIITRSRELALQINHILGAHKASWLPCPAVLSSPIVHDHPGQGRIAAILQSDSGLQSIPGEHLSDIRGAIDSTSEDIDIFAFHESECEHLASIFPDRKLRYSESPDGYLAAFGEYSAVISTRLHGALAAMSSGVPAGIFRRNDFRVNSTVELVTPIPTLEASSGIQWASQICANRYSQMQAEISSFKEKTLRRYQELISPFATAFLGNFEPSNRESRKTSL